MEARDWLMVWLGALIMGFAMLFVLTYSTLTVTVKKADRIDTFNVRWMPMLPQIRTDIIGAPHCVWYACRVV